MNLPETITVTRSLSYNVSEIVSDLKDEGVTDIDIEKIVNQIQEWVEEEMRAPISRHDIVYQNEDGEQI